MVTQETPRKRAKTRNPRVAGRIALVLTTTACFGAGYRVVRISSAGGELAVWGVRSEAQQKADAYMAGQCPHGFEIVEQGEKVVGQETVSQSTAGATRDGRRSSGTTTSTTTNKTEWRIKYRCKDLNGDAGAD